MAGEAPCEEYSGTCDVTSGFRCVRFNDVTHGESDAGEVECVCLLAVDGCPAIAAVNDSAPASPPTSDVTADVTDDDEKYAGGHSEWLLTHAHTDRLIGKHISVTFDAKMQWLFINNGSHDPRQQQSRGYGFQRRLFVCLFICFSVRYLNNRCS